MNSSNEHNKVSLFITCLVDTFFPEVGESMVKVLRKLGLEVNFLEDQTCCGQPAFNSGFQHDATVLAKRFLSIFDEADGVIVCPSGSCASMVKVFYKELFRDDPTMLEIANRVASKTYELSDYLVNVLKREDLGASYSGRVTYHSSCHLLRELKISEEPKKLIRAVRGVEFIEMQMEDACCGFGGTFAMKFPDVSVSILDEKIKCIAECGADTVVSTDMGCLMNIGGAISRRNIPIKVMHIAELLAS